MDSYLVDVIPTAQKELKWLASALVARIYPRLESLAVNPRPPGCKKLKGGESEWRISGQP
jgi:mRNA interferase RelE/StbE